MREAIMEGETFLIAVDHFLSPRDTVRVGESKLSYASSPRAFEGFENRGEYEI